MTRRDRPVRSTSSVAAARRVAEGAAEGCAFAVMIAVWLLVYALVCPAHAATLEAEPTTAQTVVGLLLAGSPIPILSVFLIRAMCGSGAAPRRVDEAPVYGDTTGFTGPEA